MKKQLFNLSTFQLFSLVSCLGAWAVLVPSACFAAAQPVLSLPPFVITGRVTDDRGAGLESAEVRVRKGETLLARGIVINGRHPDRDGIADVPGGSDIVLGLKTYATAWN